MKTVKPTSLVIQYRNGINTWWIFLVLITMRPNRFSYGARQCPGRVWFFYTKFPNSHLDAINSDEEKWLFYRTLNSCACTYHVFSNDRRLSIFARPFTVRVHVKINYIDQLFCTRCAFGFSRNAYENTAPNANNHVEYLVISIRPIDRHNNKRRLRMLTDHPGQSCRMVIERSHCEYSVFGKRFV